MSNTIEPLQFPVNKENGGIVNSIDLEEPCWSCTKSYTNYDDDVSYFIKDEEPSMKNDNGGCGICDGSGLIVTDTGKLLIAFIKRRI
jgi:hypothetical protein